MAARWRGWDIRQPCPAAGGGESFGEAAQLLFQLAHTVICGCARRLGLGARVPRGVQRVQGFVVCEQVSPSYRVVPAQLSILPSTARG